MYFHDQQPQSEQPEQPEQAASSTGRPGIRDEPFITLGGEADLSGSDSFVCEILLIWSGSSWI